MFQGNANCCLHHNGQPHTMANNVAITIGYRRQSRGRPTHPALLGSNCMPKKTSIIALGPIQTVFWQLSWYRDAILPVQDSDYNDMIVSQPPYLYKGKHSTWKKKIFFIFKSNTTLVCPVHPSTSINLSALIHQSMNTFLQVYMPLCQGRSLNDGVLNRSLSYTYFLYIYST